MSCSIHGCNRQDIAMTFTFGRFCNRCWSETYDPIDIAGLEFETLFVLNFKTRDGKPEFVNRVPDYIWNKVLAQYPDRLVSVKDNSGKEINRFIEFPRENLFLFLQN